MFLIGTGASSCKKDFLSLENNPNTPSVATPQLVLSGALKVTADIVNINYATYGTWMGYISPSGNFVPNAVLIQYNFTTNEYQVWTPLFNNLSNYNYLETSTAGSPALIYFNSIAKIMKVHNFQALVDNYNNVPYSTAFKGIDNISPSYDKGTVIYDDLIKQLDAAITAIKGAGAASTNPGSSDIVFQGEMTNWIKFANTIKLRIAIRQWNLTAKRAVLTAAVQATASEGYLDETFEAAAQPGYLNQDDPTGNKQSPFWRGYGFDQNGNAVQSNQFNRANAYAVNLLKATNDPRVNRFYLPLESGANAGKIQGNAFGDPNSLPNQNSSAIGQGLLKSFNMPGVIMSSSESLFLQAEAVTYGLITGNAQTLYEQGITASFTTLAVPNAAASAVTYYSQPIANVNWTASPNKVEAIITQKWTALNGYGNFEAYNEYRRTGFPNVPRSLASGALGTTLPFRILYPTSEYQQNAANVGAEGKIDQFTSKIFWAK